MIQLTEKPCSRCGQLLVEIDFNRTHYMHLCDNPHCPIFRQPQGSRQKDMGLGPITTFMPAPLPRTVSAPGMIKTKVRKKTTRRKGSEYARKTV